MKSLFDEAAYKEIMNRMDKMNAETQPDWGKMNAGQMMRHCQYPLEIALDKKTLPKPNVIMGLFMKSFKKSMYNDTLWKKGTPTAKEFKVEDERDFAKEKKALTILIKDFYATRNQKTREPHPAFGFFTYDQWGKCNTNTWTITCDNLGFEPPIGNIR